MRTDPVNGGVRALGRTDGFLTGPSSRDPAAIALAYVREREEVFRLDSADLDSLRLAARYRDIHGITHLTWRQTSRGVPSYDSTLSANVTRDGRLLNITGLPVHDLDIGAQAPAVSAVEAIAIARRDVRGSLTRRANPRSARLVAVADPDGDRLAWRMTVAGREPYVYDVLVDARSGKILVRHSLTDFVSNAEVVDYHPGTGPGRVPHTVDLAANPAWLNQSGGFTRLFGQNTHTYADIGAPDGFNAGEDIAPSSGTDFLYPQAAVPCATGRPASIFSGICTWDGVNRATEATNRAQATTQLFYLVNTFHDWLAGPPIGFNDASHNFEFGGTGGHDHVNAEADDYSGVNNANMATPRDGTPPRMQMYLFGAATLPGVNSADDASVVYHEYTHGLSNRLVGNGLGGALESKQARAMGEGWSDWYAMDYLVESGFIADTAADGQVREGEYVTNNARTGIRRNAIDCSVGSADSTNCPGTTSAGPGGFTLADMGQIGSYGTVDGEALTRFQVHDDGEIWSETLWDLRKAIGAPEARRLITQGMRLSPVHPSFLEMRDAILLADAALGGRHHDAIWAVFAARGMGVGAATASADATSGRPSTAVPDAAVTPRKPVVTDPAPLGDGDGVAEPGETVKLQIPLRNLTPGELTGLTATLSSSTPGVFVGQPVVSYPSIPAHRTVTPTATYAVTIPPAAIPCGGDAGLRLTVGSGAPARVELPIGNRAGTSYALGGLPAAIPDAAANGPTAGLSLPLVVADGGRVDTLRVKVKLAHSYIGDLTARLTSPSGTRVDLFERPGRGTHGSAGNDMDVTLDDAAPASIQDRPGGEVATVGTFQPDEPLARFRGEELQGTWRLRIFDGARGDEGTLQEFSIEAGSPACSTDAPPLPAASTLAATNVAETAATLNGTVNAGGAATQFGFQYGRTTAYGMQVAAGSGSASSPVPVAAAVGGLAGGVTYHFRAVALRAGTVIAAGSDQELTTPSASGGRGSAGPLGAAQPFVAGQPFVTGLPKSLRLSRKGRATFRFVAGPTGARGTIAFETSKSKKNRKPVAFGRKGFTVPAGGKVAIAVKPSKGALAKLRRLKKPRATATIVIGGKRFVASFGLRVAIRRR